MSESQRNTQVTLEGDLVLDDWRFAKANTSYLVHGLHDYPARMIPQIAERLLNLYSKKDDKILDPFCGSGTTLVEARLAGRNSIGVDINPLAVLIASVKTNPIDFQKKNFNTKSFLHELENKHQQNRDSLPSPPLGILPNLLHWFKNDVASDLQFLYQKIVAVPDSEIRDFLKVVFSETVFHVSNIDHRSSRFIRIISKEKLEEFKPHVLSKFHKKLLNSIERNEGFLRRLRLSGVEDVEAKVCHNDARKLPLPADSIDGIITSPPYGEEKNTIGYVRWAKLSMAWLRLDSGKVKETERRSLGGAKRRNVLDYVKELPSETARNLLADLSKKDPNRVRDALPFFFDYLKAMREMYRVLKDRCYCCIVIGNRSIRKKPLDMGKVTVELGDHVGFLHRKSFFRQIPMKLIPWNTPTGKTISRENIIILKKP